MSVNLYKWQNQMCPIKSFWKEKQLCISLFLLLSLMIIYITPGSQVFGHVLIANSWRRYQIAVAARRLEGRLGNASPLWSNLMWPQANLALDTAQGVQSDQRDHWLCPCGSLCPGKNSSVRGLRMSGLQQRELQPTGRQDWGKGADLICLWRGRCWTFPLIHIFGISSLKSSSISCCHLTPCKAGAGGDCTAWGLKGSRGSELRYCLSTTRNIS